MLKDYLTIYINWYAYFEIKEELRLNLYNNFHEEIKKGFEVIIKIAKEQLENTIAENVYKQIQSILESQLSVLVVGGYILYLIENKIDPEKVALKEREETNRVGSEWMQAYQEDQFETFFRGTDPILAMFLYQQAENRMNVFFSHYPELMHTEYKNISQLEKIMYWSVNQGYILSSLEEKLKKK